MNQLNEAKEKLPVAVITDYVATCWQSFNDYNNAAKNFKELYSGVKEFTEVMQSLSDAFLIAAGKLENLLEDKKVIDKEKIEAEQTLKEGISVHIDKIETVELKEPEESEDTVIEASSNEGTDCEPFEYCCDFDEPDLTAEPVVEIIPNI